MMGRVAFVLALVVVSATYGGAACSSPAPLSLALSPSIATANVPVEIVTDPDARLEVDGLPAGTTPFFTTHAPSGRRDLTIMGVVPSGLHPLTVSARLGDRVALAHLDLIGGANGSITLSVSPSVIDLVQGGSAVARVTRTGFGALDVYADALPPSIRVEPFTIPAFANEGMLRVTAGPEVKLGPGQTFTLHAKGASDLPVVVDVRPASGRLDRSFGKEGVVVENVTVQGQTPIDITSAVRQPDGKLVVVGAVYLGSAAYDVLVVRYTPDGAIDPTFGTNGIVTTDLGTSDYDVGSAVALQPDGKIVVAGNHAYEEMAVVRYETNGALDTTFGTNGVFRGVKGATYSSGALGVAIQGDGAIVACGWSSGVARALRLSANGALDTTFGTNGTITGAQGAFPGVAVQQADQKLVFAGYDTSDIVVWRRNTDGSADASFGVNGERTIDFAGGLDRGQSVAIQKDGTILVGGTIVKGTASYLAVSKLSALGALDASFGNAGKALVALSGGKGGAPLFVQPDGRILLGGGSSYNGTTSTVLARLLPSGVLDPSFDGTGVVFVNTGSKDQWWGHVDMQGDGKIVTVGFAGEPIKNAVMARFYP